MLWIMKEHSIRKQGLRLRYKQISLLIDYSQHATTTPWYIYQSSILKNLWNGKRLSAPDNYSQAYQTCIKL